MTDISISIVTVNQPQLLRKCLECLSGGLEDLETQIFVSQNGPDNGATTRVVLDFPHVKLIVHNRNLGYNGANAHVLPQMTGRYLLLMNDDVFVKSDTLPTLVEFMDTYDSVGAAGVQIRLPDGSLQQPYDFFPGLLTDLIYATPFARWFPHNPITRARTAWDPNRLREAEDILGAFVLYRRTAVEQVGLLDPTFYNYYGECDLSYRIKQAGWKIYYVPWIEITHSVSRTVRHPQLMTGAIVSQYRDMFTYYKKHKPNTTVMLLRISLIAVFCLRSIRWLLIKASHSERYDEASAKLAAYSKLIPYYLPKFRSGS